MARKRRKRSKSRLRRRASSLLYSGLARVLAVPGVRAGLAIAVAYVLVLNSIVRYVGHGDAFLLSVLRIPEKSYAVAALALHSVSHLWNAHDEDPRELVTRAANEQGVPASLALAIAHTESGMRPHCISAAGAMGMMQLMPMTALAHGVIDPYDPEQNARGAMKFMRELARRYGNDHTRIAAAYNAGAARVARSGALTGLPAETQAYVGRVVGRRAN